MKRPCDVCGEETYTHIDNCLFPWCPECDPKILAEKFGEWTSGNELIDNFIKQTQLRTNLYDTYLEWIDPGELSNVKHLDDGGFGSVYTATWSKGIREYHLVGMRDQLSVFKRVRTGPRTVVLKTLHCLQQENITDLINEIEANFVCQHMVYGVTMVIGITKHPHTNLYSFVMWHYENGNLRSTFKAEQGNNVKLSDCISKLFQISTGLRSIHEKGWIHRDLHSGNILVGSGVSGLTSISDFGLCRPVSNAEDKEDGKYGVVPYMAPELFNEDQPHTKESDIYALGIIMWELLAKQPAFQNRAHDTNLILDICNGLRPTILRGTPSCWIELMQKCWNEDSLKRPTATEIFNIVNTWHGNQAMMQQFKNAQIYYDEHLQQKIDPGAIYTSRLIPHVTREMITKNLREKFE